MYTHFFQQFMEKMAICEQFCCNSCFHGNIDESSALLVVLFYPGNSAIKLFFKWKLHRLVDSATFKKQKKDQFLYREKSMDFFYF